MSLGRRLALVTVIVILGGFAVYDGVRLGDAAPWRQMYDFADFYCAGQALDMHRDPYAYEPLHTCEHRVNLSERFQRDPALAIPAPQPPYDFPPFMALARLSFANAEATYAIAVAVAVLLAILALARTGVPLDVAAIALALPAGYVELNAGQIVPFALLFLTVCGAALAAKRNALAGVFAGLTAIEPHLGLPVALSVLLFVPRARATLLATLGALVIAGILVVGPPATLEYALRVLPGQAAAEVVFPYQYSLTFALNELGVSAAVAQAAGAISFAVVLIAGLWIAPRLAQSLARRDLLVFFPAATAVMGGAYVHMVEMCFAIPAAVAMAVSLRGWQRNASAAALCVLMLPWIQLWSIKRLFALSMLLCVLLLARLQIALPFAAGTLAVLAALIYGFELRPPALPDAFRASLRFPPDTVVQDEWRAFTQTLRTPDRGWLAIKIPIWCGLATLFAVAVARARGVYASAASISRRI